MKKSEKVKLAIGDKIDPKTLTPSQKEAVKAFDKWFHSKKKEENQIFRIGGCAGAGKDYLIPMVTEEPSVVAACSNAAKMARPGGGFTTDYTGNIMISQIQLLDVPAPNYAKGAILANKAKIAEICNAKDPVLVSMGGGVKDVEVRVLDSIIGIMVIVHLLVDTGDAMGANAVNTMAETVAPFLEELTGGRAELRILSNLADHRLARARAVFKKEAIGGEEVVDKMIAAYVQEFPARSVLPDHHHRSRVGVAVEVQTFHGRPISDIQLVAVADVVARKYSFRPVGHMHLHPLVAPVVGKGRAPSALV